MSKHPKSSLEGEIRKEEYIAEDLIGASPLSCPAGVKMCPSKLEGVCAPTAESKKARSCFTHLDLWEPQKQHCCGFPGCQILLIKAESFPYVCAPG